MHKEQLYIAHLNLTFVGFYEVRIKKVRLICIQNLIICL